MSKLAASVFAWISPVLFMTAVHATAPSPESIDALLAAMNTEATLNEMIPVFERSIRQSTAAMQGPANAGEQLPMLDEMAAMTSRILREELGWAQMHPIYAQAYAETFTQEEVDGLVAFYKSAAGQAYVSKMPAVAQKTMALMQSRMVPIFEKVKASAEELAAKRRSAK